MGKEKEVGQGKIKKLRVKGIYLFFYIRHQSRLAENPEYDQGSGELSQTSATRR